MEEPAEIIGGEERNLPINTKTAATNSVAAVFLKKFVAGAEGLEPSNDGTKTRCLTDLATPLHRLLAGYTL